LENGKQEHDIHAARTSIFSFCNVSENYTTEEAMDVKLFYEER
jgi:hypothetical protein